MKSRFDPIAHSDDQLHEGMGTLAQRAGSAATDGDHDMGGRIRIGGQLYRLRGYVVQPEGGGAPFIKIVANKVR